MTRAHKGLLQMLGVFLILLGSIGLPHNLSGAVGYGILLAMSTVASANLELPRDKASNLRQFMECVVFSVGYLWIIILPIQFLNSDYAASTLAGSFVIFISTCLAINTVMSPGANKKPETKV